ncbi:MAG: inorganic phosphate transporter [Chlamydiales bacterium]|nr:inorganic phosphate transporter [Chlamydiales bacterium]
MEVESILRILVLAIGFYMAWNIGANDVSNAMGTSVGSGALTLRRAVILAAILEFCGAFFVGAPVTETMQKGLIDTTLFASQPLILILGMCAALLGTALWLQIASICGWPVSTTHAIVGAILGFGALVGGADAINWGETGSVAISWVLSPVLSGLFAFLLFNLLQKKILFTMNPTESTLKLFPLLIFFVFGTFTLSLIFNGLENLDLSLSFPEALGIALLVGLICATICYFILRRAAFPLAAEATVSRHLPQHVISLEKAVKHLQRVHVSSSHDTHEKVGTLLEEVKTLSQRLRKETSFAERASEYHVVEKLFGYLQIFSACFVAFAHGANDVANAIGPVAAVLDIIKNGVIPEVASVPTWLLAFGGLGIVIGLATFGWRVMETIGKKITELTPTRGFCAEFGAATTILLASKMGLPISTTHCLVGAVLGVGMARGFRALNMSTVREIILSWIVTIPASAIISILCFYILKFIFV